MRIFDDLIPSKGILCLSIGGIAATSFLFGYLGRKKVHNFTKTLNESKKEIAYCGALALGTTSALVSAIYISLPLANFIERNNDAIVNIFERFSSAVSKDCLYACSLSGFSFSLLSFVYYNHKSSLRNIDMNSKEAYASNSFYSLMSSFLLAPFACICASDSKNSNLKLTLVAGTAFASVGIGQFYVDRSNKETSPTIYSVSTRNATIPFNSPSSSTDRVLPTTYPKITSDAQMPHLEYTLEQFMETTDLPFNSKYHQFINLSDPNAVMMCYMGWGRNYDQLLHSNFTSNDNLNKLLNEMRTVIILIRNPSLLIKNSNRIDDHDLELYHNFVGSQFVFLNKLIDREIPSKSDKLVCVNNFITKIHSAIANTDNNIYSSKVTPICYTTTHHKEEKVRTPFVKVQADEEKFLDLSQKLNNHVLEESNEGSHSLVRRYVKHLPDVLEVFIERTMETSVQPVVINNNGEVLITLFKQDLNKNTISILPYKIIVYQIESCINQTDSTLSLCHRAGDKTYFLNNGAINAVDKQKALEYFRTSSILRLKKLKELECPIDVRESYSIRAQNEINRLDQSSKFKIRNECGSKKLNQLTIDVNNFPQKSEIVINEDILTNSEYNQFRTLSEYFQIKFNRYDEVEGKEEYFDNPLEFSNDMSIEIPLKKKKEKYRIDFFSSKINNKLIFGNRLNNNEFEVFIEGESTIKNLEDTLTFIKLADFIRFRKFQVSSLSNKQYT